jgi:hypothetical protein
MSFVSLLRLVVDPARFRINRVPRIGEIAGYEIKKASCLLTGAPMTKAVIPIFPLWASVFNGNTGSVLRSNHEINKAHEGHNNRGDT